MNRNLIEQINALAKKQKETGLTEEEKATQKALREEYLATFRSQFKEHLVNITVVDEEGKDVTPEKLKHEKEQARQDKLNKELKAVSDALKNKRHPN